MYYILYMFIISDLGNGYSVNFLDIIAVISIISGIFIIISKNPIVSVLFLILLFSSISVYLILIGMKFIGLSYLLVYVGAVSILFLFILMLIDIRVSELNSDTKNSIPLAILVIIAFFIPLNQVVPDFKELGISSDYSEQIYYITSYSWDINILDVSDIMSIGNIMYTNYFIWLILVSIILLLAMVGSIVITIRNKQV